eukprot:354954-Chlamydomonas_euryale.AAC.2
MQIQPLLWAVDRVAEGRCHPCSFVPDATHSLGGYLEPRRPHARYYWDPVQGVEGEEEEAGASGSRKPERTADELLAEAEEAVNVDEVGERA